MSQIEKAIAEGRCAIAVSAALLRDAEVMRQVSGMLSLRPMALSGPITSPLEQRHRFSRQLFVAGFRDLLRAWGDAPSHLVQQARPFAVAKDLIGTGP